MKKSLFSWEEACRVAWDTSPGQLKVQLHQWMRRGEIRKVRRGLYAFSDVDLSHEELVRTLYVPAYISLQTALHFYGLIPDVPFAVTLVTPRISRTFTTAWGQFIYHKIHRDYFWGYDPDTLMGKREKVLVDYFYFYSERLSPKPDFWESMRWQNLADVDFSSAIRIAKRFRRHKKMTKLLESLARYGAEYGTT